MEEATEPVEQKVKPPKVPSRLPAGVASWTRLRDEEVGKEPIRSHESDVGYDLVCSRYVPVAPHVRAQVPTNIAVAIPDGHFGLVLPRSSMFHKRGLMGQIGVIDSGYRGEIMFMVYNPGVKQVHITEGERLAQLIVLPVSDVIFQEVRGEKKMPKGERGIKGFGSTGGFGGEE
jgi:dUTP pyrophosphatase